LRVQIERGSGNRFNLRGGAKMLRPKNNQSPNQRPEKARTSTNPSGASATKSNQRRQPHRDEFAEGGPFGKTDDVIEGAGQIGARGFDPTDPSEPYGNTLKQNTRANGSVNKGGG
jgi:hypothetical protein